MDSNRRIFLTAASVAVLAAWGGRAGFSRPLAGRIAPGVQLYTLKRDLLSDFDGTLAKVRAIGFRSVESATLFGRTPTAFRASLDRAGLICPSIHLPAVANGAGLSLSGDIGALARDLRIVGCRTVVMPTFLNPPNAPPRLPDESGYHYARRTGLLMTAADWRRNAVFLNEAALKLAVEGLRLTYHNHNPEFAPLAEGGTGMDILLVETDPNLVGFELDIGWAAAAGQDLKALIARHPGRFRQMHAKDIKATTKANFAYAQDPTSVGDGIVDWRGLLPMAIKAGIDEIYVEQEPPYPHDALEAIAASYRYLTQSTSRPAR
jgi:sugar phosphate isomerase/epimerase